MEAAPAPPIPPGRQEAKLESAIHPFVHPSIWQRRPRALSQTTATHSRAFTLIKSSSSSAKLVHKCFNGKAAPAEGADCNHLTPFIRKNQFFFPSFTSICTLRRLTRNCAEHFSIFFFFEEPKPSNLKMKQATFTGVDSGSEPVMSITKRTSGTARNFA